MRVDGFLIQGVHVNKHTCYTFTHLRIHFTGLRTDSAYTCQTENSNDLRRAHRVGPNNCCRPLVETQAGTITECVWVRQNREKYYSIIYIYIYTYVLGDVYVCVCVTPESAYKIENIIRSAVFRHQEHQLLLLYTHYLFI